MPDSNATAEQRDSVVTALELWRIAVGDATTWQLTMQEPAENILHVRFEPAALAFFGIYESETQELIINSRLDDSHDRSITIAHELGHAIGLEHVDFRSVMRRANLEIQPTAEDAMRVNEMWEDCRARAD